MYKATTPSGREFRRGEAVLCRVSVGTFTAHIDKIEPGELGEVTVNLNIMTGSLRTLGTGQSTMETPVAYEYGFYHQSTKNIRAGNTRPVHLFCFADEEPDWNVEPVKVEALVEDIVDGDTGSLTPAGEPSEPDRPLTNRERKNLTPRK